MEFAGFEITPTTVKPCRKYVRAISDFPTPRNITDVRSWFGLVNQVSYAFNMTAAMAPFRELLKPTRPFEWNDTHKAAFAQSKLQIAKEIQHGVEIFDKSKPTYLATDWSKDGVGYWLFQKHCSYPSDDICCQTGWKITLVGSRFTHSAESRYAPIEGEALAVADALDKARHFVLGCKKLTVAVDHKPLVKIFGDRSIDQIGNTRLHNLKERTLRYRFRVIHIPDVKNKMPDALPQEPPPQTEWSCRTIPMPSPGALNPIQPHGRHLGRRQWTRRRRTGGRHTGGTGRRADLNPTNHVGTGAVGHIVRRRGDDPNRGRLPRTEEPQGIPRPQTSSIHIRRGGRLQRQDHHPQSTWEDVPLIATHCTPGNIPHDSEGRVIPASQPTFTQLELSVRIATEWRLLRQPCHQSHQP